MMHQHILTLLLQYFVCFQHFGKITWHLLTLWQLWHATTGLTSAKASGTVRSICSSSWALAPPASSHCWWCPDLPLCGQVALQASQLSYPSHYYPQLFVHCQWRTKSKVALIPLKHFYKTTQHFPFCNFTSHQGADKLCDTKHYEPTFIIHRNNVSDLSQWRTKSILPPWSSRATNVFIPASFDWRRWQLLAGQVLTFI